MRRHPSVHATTTSITHSYSIHASHMSEPDPQSGTRTRDHTLLILPFTPELLDSPHALLPIIYRSVTASLRSHTVLFCTPRRSISATSAPASSPVTSSRLH